jgi:hypothetical protein
VAGVSFSRGSVAVRSPDKREAPEGTGADATYTIATANFTTSTTRTDNTSAFGAMLERPVTSSRTCEGPGCWCHIGASTAWPIGHFDALARMSRQIRALEIAQGVQI